MAYRKTRKMTAAIEYLRRPYVLEYKDPKESRFKVQVVRGPVIKGDEVVAYATQAASVPEATLRMTVNALFDAINYFCAQGHRVMIPGLGSFASETTVKAVSNPNEANADTIKNRRIRFYPKAELQSGCSKGNISFKENVSLTAMACGTMKRWDSNSGDDSFLVDCMGRLVVFGTKVGKISEGETYATLVELSTVPEATKKAWGTYLAPSNDEAWWVHNMNTSYYVEDNKVYPAPTGVYWRRGEE